MGYRRGSLLSSSFWPPLPSLPKWPGMPAFFTRVWDPPSATRGATCAPLLAASIAYALYILLLVLENTACLLRVSGMSVVKTEDGSCIRLRSAKTHVVVLHGNTHEPVCR